MINLLCDVLEKPLLSMYFPPNINLKVKVLLSHVQLFVTPWTVARQAPLSMELSRQEHCSG